MRQRSEGTGETKHDHGVEGAGGSFDDDDDGDDDGGTAPWPESSYAAAAHLERSSPPPPPPLLLASSSCPRQCRVGIELGRCLPERDSRRWMASVGGRPSTGFFLVSEFETVGSQAEAALVRLCKGRPGRTLVFANSAPRANEAFKLRDELV